jgi:GTP-sensing pleiotropic transcriptional regulator CodY
MSTQILRSIWITEFIIVNLSPKYEFKNIINNRSLSMVLDLGGWT